MKWILRDVEARKNILIKNCNDIKAILHKMLELSKERKREIDLYCSYKQKLIKMSNSSIYWS